MRLRGSKRAACHTKPATSAPGEQSVLLNPDTCEPVDWTGIALASASMLVDVGRVQHFARPAEPAPHARLISMRHETGDRTVVVKAEQHDDIISRSDPYHARLISTSTSLKERADGELAEKASEGEEASALGPTHHEPDAGRRKYLRPIDEELLDVASRGHLHLPYQAPFQTQRAAQAAARAQKMSSRSALQDAHADFYRCASTSAFLEKMLGVQPVYNKLNTHSFTFW